MDVRNPQIDCHLPANLYQALGSLTMLVKVTNPSLEDVPADIRMEFCRIVVSETHA